MFIHAVEALAQLLGYKPLSQPPCTLFCNNVKAMHALLNSTYNHNNNAPISRTCPRRKCMKWLEAIKTFADEYQPGVDSVSDVDLKQNLLLMQNYLKSVKRNNPEMINSIVANLAIALRDVCDRIEKTLPDRGVSREDLSWLKNRVNLIFTTFGLVIQADLRCRNVSAGKKIQPRIWTPKLHNERLHISTCHFST